MCKADLLAVAQLEKECFAEAWSENALAESLAEANYVFFVAVVSKPSCMADEKDTEEIAGYVGAYLAADELSITNVAVFSSYRRCGAANQLMKALDAFAQEKNLYGITLEVRVSIMQQLHYMKKMVMKNLVFAKDFTANQRKMP